MPERFPRTCWSLAALAAVLLAIALPARAQDHIQPMMGKTANPRISFSVNFFVTSDPRRGVAVACTKLNITQLMATCPRSIRIHSIT